MHSKQVILNLNPLPSKVCFNVFFRFMLILDECRIIRWVFSSVIQIFLVLVFIISLAKHIYIYIYCILWKGVDQCQNLDTIQDNWIYLSALLDMTTRIFTRPILEYSLFVIWIISPARSRRETERVSERDRERERGHPGLDDPFCRCYRMDSLNQCYLYFVWIFILTPRYTFERFNHHPRLFSIPPPSYHHHFINKSPTSVKL